MKIPKLSYIDFIQQSEAVRIELQEYILVAVLFDIECMEWNWGKVKKAQDILLGELTYKDIFDVAQLESPSVTEKTDFHVILGLFNAVKKSMAVLDAAEAEALNYTPTPKELQAIESVGGFDSFGSYPSTLKLSSLFHCDIREVDSFDWTYCFTALVYDKRTNDFNKKVLTND